MPFVVRGILCLLHRTQHHTVYHRKRTRSLGFSFAENGENETKLRTERINEALKSSFRPEFLNRIDDIIIFNKLSRENVLKITDILLSDLSARLLALGIKIRFDEAVKERIATEGFDEKFGARPIKRAIRRLIEDPLANKLLSGNLNKKKSLRVTLEDRNIAFL